ncbi:MAG: ribosome assembly cofactor RimP [Candidatus Cryptobacteroides sp.]
MDTALIYRKIEEIVAARGCFVIEVTVSSDNDILIAVESEEGVVDMEDCVYISEKFQEIFNRDEEDYALTVTSAGLDQPFRILKQYIKAVGTMVEVKVRDGRKLKCTLLEADEDGFTVEYEAKEAVPGKKKKELVRREERFAFDAVNSVTPYIEFE